MIEADSPWDVLSDLAAAQTQAGLFEEALQTALRIGFPLRRSEALVSIANAQARACDIEGSRSTFAEACKAVEKIDDPNSLGRALTPYSRSQALGHIAIGQAQASRFAEAYETAMSINELCRRADVLSKIATQQAERGEIEGARLVFAEAVSTAKAVDSKYKSAGLLRTIASAESQDE